MKRRNRNPQGTEKGKLQTDIDDATIKTLSRPKANGSIGQGTTPDYQPSHQEPALSGLEQPAFMSVSENLDMTGNFGFQFPAQEPMAGLMQAIHNNLAEETATPLPMNSQQDYSASSGPLIQIQPVSNLVPGSDQFWAQGMQPTAGVSGFDILQLPQSSSIQQCGGPQGDPEMVAIMTGPNNQPLRMPVIIDWRYRYSLISARLASALGCEPVVCQPNFALNQAPFGLPPTQRITEAISIELQWGQFPTFRTTLSFLVDDSNGEPPGIVLGKPILQLLSSLDVNATNFAEV